ncbi:MAG TPA: ABC transporter permease [Gemmatimonadaceae bacterium]|nr:ABC transporter permease [Gemmatimonadaceae bacterium]
MSHPNRDDDRMWARIRRVFRLPSSPRRMNAEVDEELRFHLEGRIEELMASEGLNRSAAEAEARRRFGDFGQYRREAREIDQATHDQRERMHARESLARESRRAVRTLLRSPGFSFITVVTLALGIGAATAIFTLLDAVVLRPLPYANADRLVSLSSPVPLMKGQTRWGLARHQMFYILREGRTFENLAVYNTSEVTLLGAGDLRPERVRSVSTSASLFDVLGFVPQHGRVILKEENSARRPAVAVLGHGLWQRRYGSDPGVVGRTINIEGLSLTVVGVLPPRADLPDLKVDLWVPAFVDSTTNWNNHTWSAIGRLKPGFTAADAERDVAPLTQRLPEAYPDVYGKDFVKNTGFRTEIVPLRDAVVGDMVTRALWTLFGAVGLVLLIAGANVANLFLVRMDARRRDVAVRTALGAGRGHLATQYLAEGLILAGVAGVLALAFAQGLLRLLLALAPSELPRLSEVHLGAPSVAFAVGIVVLAGLMFGMLPLLAARLDLAMLREGGRGLTTSRRRMNVRRLLVATQMALAVVLLASAALMLRTFGNLRAVQPGFDPERVLTLTVALPRARFGGQTDRSSDFHQQLAMRLAQLPGVRDVGMTDRLPLVSGDLCIGITLEGPTPESARGVCPPSTRVSPGYFEAIGTRVEGRTITWSGMNARDGSVVVSRAFADAHWPTESAIGKRVRFNGTTPPWYTVVGVAEDVRSLGVDRPPSQLVYFPLREIPGSPLWELDTSMELVLRTTAGDPLTLANAVSRIITELEPEAAVVNPRTMDSILARSIARQSFTMVLLLISATIAMLLSAVGIYGVISYIVAQRRGEIGVRVALGASVREVTGMVLRQSLGLAVAGLVVGVLAALATTRFLRTLLFGVEPGDPLTLVLVPGVLLVVALLASYVPARRAARVDPVEALRG